MGARRVSLALPMAMRAELKVPIGTLLSGEPSETVARLSEILECKQPPMFAVVGDCSAKNTLDAGLEPDIIVVDYRVMRENIEPLDHGSRRELRTRNPAGTIDADAWAALGEAITLKSQTAVIVEGEEDLLVLPLISLMPLGSLIVYGQPREGIVVVEVSEERRVWVEALMARMEELKNED